MAKILFIMCVTLLMPSLVFAQDGGYGNMDGGWHMMPYGYGGFFMWILLIGAIILIVFLVTRPSKDKSNEPKPNESALDILKKRYARGEITKEEFEQMKQDLNN
jgi:putative membrane protein